jgi:TetR/AcrR family transcriptional repressor of nem operon
MLPRGMPRSTRSTDDSTRKGRAAAEPPSTAAQVLDAAERLVQTSGYNGFSYADVSAEVGISKASLHYHFASKAELGRAVIERYRESFERALAAIDAATADPLDKLGRYAQMYRDVLAAGRMCLCGMLAAEYATLPKPMQRAIHAFFDANETWLQGVLEQGRAAGALGFLGTSRDAARLLTAALEGAMLLARSYGEPSRLTTAARHLLDDLAARGANDAAVRRTRRR